VKEILRLYPPAWIIGRETRSDVTLADGTRIARGMTVFMAPLILHRRAEYFEDPERFDPQRWTGEDPVPFSYVPFGGGARRCIGEEFARNEMRIVLEPLLRKFRFTFAGDSSVPISASVTLRPAGPVLMRAILRERSSAVIRA
jgi:cytochrome P450